MRKKIYKVIILMRDHSSYSGNWVLTNWYTLEEYLSNGWVIERTDSFSGGGGKKPSGGAIVYILFKIFEIGENDI